MLNEALNGNLIYFLKKIKEIQFLFLLFKSKAVYLYNNSKFDII